MLNLPGQGAQSRAEYSINNEEGIIEIIYPSKRISWDGFDPLQFRDKVSHNVNLDPNNSLEPWQHFNDTTREN